MSKTKLKTTTKITYLNNRLKFYFKFININLSYIFHSCDQATQATALLPKFKIAKASLSTKNSK